MLRVGTGIAKGRRLKSVTGAIRPTGSRVRGSLFDILSSRIDDCIVLDLCAGSGSLGIEALSRGARCCLFIDNDRRAVRMIKDNLGRCGFGGQLGQHGRHAQHGRNVQIGQSSVWLTDAVRGLDQLADRSCTVDFILADPPYGDPVAQEIIRIVGERSLLTPGGLLVIEHRGDDPPETCGGLELVRRRDIGETALSFFRSDWSDRSDPGTTTNRSENLPIDLPPPSSRTRR